MAKINSVIHRVSLVILEISNNFIPLLGRNWLDIFYPNWRNASKSSATINSLARKESSGGNFEQEIKKQFPKVFNNDFSNPIVGYEADLVLKQNQPIFRKAYEVPYKLREKVLHHLDLLEQQNIITPILISEWASPVVIILKKERTMK